MMSQYFYSSALAFTSCLCTASRSARVRVWGSLRSFLVMSTTLQARHIYSLVDPGNMSELFKVHCGCLIHSLFTAATMVVNLLVLRLLWSWGEGNDSKSN